MHRVILKAFTYKHMERLMTSILGASVTIYTLHRPTPDDESFHGIDVQLLERCLVYAREHNYEFIALDDLIEIALSGKRLSRPTLCFTLDDGYVDQVSTLVPVLLKYQAQPTLFAITDFVDAKDWPWDSKLAHVIWYSPRSDILVQMGAVQKKFSLAGAALRVAARREIIRYAKSLNENQLAPFMTHVEQACDLAAPVAAPENQAPTNWAELRRCEQQGLRVGAHSRSHRVFSSLEDQTVVDELIHSKQRIAVEVLQPSRVFCFPSGAAEDYALRNIPLVANAGFNAAVTTVSRTTNTSAIKRDPYQINRIAFPDSFERFVRYSSWMETLREKLPR